ncbi:MAG TPA: Yip1 family protein [Bacteroidota bacterium]|nr:Yip1 family protein [Bacteroidota bacterium]
MPSLSVLMIPCPVCGTTNDELQTVCVQCGSFLQGRVDALNLFETVWGLVESPHRTFKKIVLSKHKNYVLLLSVLFGIGLMFDIFWAKRLGDVIGNLLTLTGLALIVGPLAGIVTTFLVSLALQVSTRLWDGRATLRNMYAACSYALSPMAVSLFVVVPLEIAAFGVHFFGTNPPPMLIKPTAYVLILVLKAVFTVYAVYLLVAGTMAANGFARNKMLPVVASVVLVVAAGGATLHLVNVR